MKGCFLARFSDRPCEGRLIRAHLIPRQLINREVPFEIRDLAIQHPGSWVAACGGVMGNAGHHGMLDASRTLRVPREALPEQTEELAVLLGLEWWLDREYGPRAMAA